VIETVKNKILSDQSVQDALQGSLGMGVAGTSAASLAGWINIASSLVSVFGLIVGVGVTYFTFINAKQRAKQNKIKTEMDQLALDKARADILTLHKTS